MEELNPNASLTRVCGEILKRLETNPDCRKEYVNGLLQSGLKPKMSEQDYAYYQFIKALSQMYQAGLDEGKDLVETPKEATEVDEKQDQLTIGKFLNQKISDRKKVSDNYVIKIAPIIKNIREGGATSLKDVAAKLTEMGIKTISGNYLWHPATVREVEVKIGKRLAELRSLNASIREQISLLK